MRKYKISYTYTMPQLTIYLDEDSAALVEKAVKSTGISKSKWIAEAIRLRAREEWPPEFLALAGAWKDEDFPSLAEIRKGYGTDVPREKF